MRDGEYSDDIAVNTIDELIRKCPQDHAPKAPSDGRSSVRKLKQQIDGACNVCKKSCCITRLIGEVSRRLIKLFVGLRLEADAHV